MKKTIAIAITILTIFILVKIVDLFIYQFPIEVTNEQFRLLIGLTFPFSIAGISIIILINQIQNTKRIKYLWNFFAIIGFIFSFFYCFIVVFTSKVNFIDKDTIYQSLENNNDRIILQYVDLGALGSELKEIRIGREFFGIRYAERFHETTLNGNWIFYDLKNNRTDTLELNNFVYKSEINIFRTD